MPAFDFYYLKYMEKKGCIVSESCEGHVISLCQGIGRLQGQGIGVRGWDEGETRDNEMIYASYRYYEVFKMVMRATISFKSVEGPMEQRK